MILSKSSRKYIQFITKYYNNIHPLNKKDEELLEKIYDQIHASYKYLKLLKKKDKNIVYKKQYLKINYFEQIPKPTTFNPTAFPQNMRTYIDETMEHLVTYDISLMDMNIKIHFVIEKMNNDMTLAKYDSYIDKIIQWLYIVNKYANNKCVKDLTIYFYLTSLKKRLPVTSIDILGEKHMNTAFTYSCPVNMNAEIIIYRQEEWFKVFIHETFHTFGLDFSGIRHSLADCNKEILSIFKVKSDVNLYEAYAEFWAKIFNAGFCAYHIIDKKDDIHSFVTKYHILITWEKDYTTYQMVKILNFLGLTYKNLYSSSKYAGVLRDNLYKENTNVLAYYIINAVLLNNYTYFLEWCDKNNIHFFQFKQTTGNLNKLCDFIKKKYKDINMLSNVEKTENILNNIKNTKKNEDILMNTRMTLCELL